MGRLLGPLLSLALASLLVVVVAPAVQPQAAHAVDDSYVAPYGASFNIPRSTRKAKFRTEQRIVDAINNAQPRSVIRIAVYSFDRINVADALIAAKRRGVYVQMLVNNHQRTRAMRRLGNVLGTDRWRSSFIYECQYGCRTDRENLHAKYFLFRHTGSTRWVSMFGSYNLTGNAAINQWNDLWTIRGKEEVYRKLSDLFAEMRRDQHLAEPYRVDRVDPQYLWQVFPFRNFSATNDPVMSALDRIRCRGATINHGKTKVWLNMAVIDDYRGDYLARKVRRLYAAGCDVKVIYGVATKRIREIFASRTQRGYVPVHVSGYDTDYNGTMDLYGHEKTFTVSGNFGGIRNANMAFTSSGNWSTSGILGDELFFRIRGRGAMRAYKNHFRYMWKNGSHLAAYIPYGNGRAAYTPAEAPQPALRGPAWEND